MDVQPEANMTMPPGRGLILSVGLGHWRLGCEGGHQSNSSVTFIRMLGIRPNKTYSQKMSSYLHTLRAECPQLRTPAGAMKIGGAVPYLGHDPSTPSSTEPK